jgi:hypothetical protein
MAVRPMGRSDLPQDIQDILKKPLPAEAIGAHPKISGLSSIKAAFVIERLNEAFGAGGWDDSATIIDRCTRTDVWNAGQPNEKKVTMHVATVQLTFMVEKYGIHKQNFGGSDNIDLGDALKGARTDALTKIASELGIGLDVYKSGRESKGDELPPCPSCGKMLRKSKDKDELYCWVKKDGCGATFSEEGLKAAIASKNKPPQSAQQPRPQSQPSTNGHAGKFPLKGTVTDRHTERKDGESIFWLTVGDKKCATKQPEVMNQLAKAFKGSHVEMLVTKLSGQNGDIFQIREVIRVTPPQEGGRN